MFPNDISKEHVIGLKKYVTKVILLTLLLIDPPALLFSYYIFAGLRDYPVWVIFAGYLIMFATFGLLTIFISRKLAEKSLLDGKFNLPTVLSILLFIMNFIAATFIGIFAKLIKPLPEETLMLRLSGSLAINMLIITLFVVFYSNLKLLKEYTGERYKNIMIPISMKLTTGVLAISLWIAPILLKYLTLRTELSNEMQRNFVITSIGLNIILGLSVIFLSKRILKYVPKIVTSLNAISNGNLTEVVSVESADELRYISNKLNEATKGINNVIKGTVNISDSSISVLKDLENKFYTFKNVAGNTVSAVEIQQQGIERITSSIEEITANIEQLSMQAQSLADLAMNVQHLADTLDEKSKTSTDELKKVKEITSGFVKEYETLEDGINELTEATRNIGDIIESVRKIAEQTNLLALNAAIEAARAGEAGRGFAVVADEIRKLAEETKTSTDTITSTIETIKTYSKALNEQIQRLREGIKSTESGYDRLFDTFGYLEKAVKDISSAIDTLAAHSEEQNASVEEMRSGVNEIAENVSKISAQGEGITSKMQEIEKQLEVLSSKLKDTSLAFEQLKTELGKFKIS